MDGFWCLSRFGWRHCCTVRCNYQATNAAYGVDLGVLWRGIPANIPFHDLRRDAIVAGDQAYSAQAFRLEIDLRQPWTLAQGKGVMQSQWNVIDAGLFRNDVLRICAGTAAISVS